MEELYQLLGIKLAATTAYHLQGDGQMERINQELEQYLQLFINQRQDNWVGLLSFTEFQYNNHVHSATQQPPFLLDTGQVPHMGFEPGQQRSHLKLVNEFKECMGGQGCLANRPSRKLSHHRLGLFPIVKKVSNDAYQL